MKQDLFDSIFPKDQILFNEPMKKHTSFKLGGNCDVMILPNNIEQIRSAIDICKKNNIKYYVIGNGSNIIVKDDGYRGVIIKISKNLSGFDIISDSSNNTGIYAESGILLSSLANICLKHSLTGFEFASGIPGTLGGAVYMNAGAYDGEISHVISKVQILNEQNDIVTLSNADCEFGYRTSKIQCENYIVLAANILLKKHHNTDEIKSKMLELNKKRADKQPLNFASAGSTFKRPQGNFAGKLIQDAGLAGFSIGGASVSEKHCGFIINNGNATSKDVLDLMLHVQNIVFEKFDVMLQPEPKILE